MLIIGHRGCAGIEPENTLRAVARAIELGVDYVEVDVRACKTGEIIVIHDATVDRTTSGKGYVRDLSFEELRKLDAGHGEKLPTLEEVIELVKGKCELFIEIKEEDIWEKVMKIVEEKRVMKDVVIVSFFHSVIRDLKRKYPEVRCGIIFTCEPVNPSSLAHDAGAEILLPNCKYLTKRLIDKAHEAGLKVITWTVNQLDEGMKLKKLHVDGIATDRPDLMIKLRS